MNKFQKIIAIHTMLFTSAFLLNYFWEILHTPLYVSTMNHDFFSYMYMAAVDTFLVFFIYWIVCLQARTFLWLDEFLKHSVLIIVSGIFLSFFIEVKNVYFTHVWTYTAAMPIIPFLQIGLSPVLQMIITPLVTFYVTKGILKWVSRISER